MYQLSSTCLYPFKRKGYIKPALLKKQVKANRVVIFDCYNPHKKGQVDNYLAFESIMKMNS